MEPVYGCLHCIQRDAVLGVIIDAKDSGSAGRKLCTIKNAFISNKTLVEPCENKGTLAEGIAIAAPARGAEILKAVRETHGDIIGVKEQSISSARQVLANKGIYVEITSAANYAGYLDYINKYPELEDKIVVLPLTGAGIKSN